MPPVAMCSTSRYLSPNGVGSMLLKALPGAAYLIADACAKRDAARSPLALRFQRPTHERVGGVAHGEPPVEDRVHGFDERHVDLLARRQSMGGERVLHTLGHHAHLREDL